MIASSSLFLLGSLFLCSHVEAGSSYIDTLKNAAVQMEGPLTCNTWDCPCAFNLQPGCCCAANEMFQVEDETFERIMNLWHYVTSLHSRVKALTDSSKIAFKATMNSNIATTSIRCFGPFNINVPLPFSEVTLNDGDGYNPSLGIFTAPYAGVYVFSFTIYSFVGRNGHLYHKVILMKNGVQIVSVWEHNREDGEDSASQVLSLEMLRGDQVYLVLIQGRKLCHHLEYNIFTGHMLYPYTDDKSHDFD